MCNSSISAATGPNTAVIVGVVCSLIVGVLLGVVSVYLILRVRGRLSGPTSPPLPPPATYEEVGVVGEKSHDIQLTSKDYKANILQPHLMLHMVWYRLSIIILKELSVVFCGQNITLSPYFSKFCVSFFGDIYC